MESDLFGTQAASADDIEEVEEELTAAEVLQKLEEAWRNEKHSPEILEPKMEIVECMMEQVKIMEDNLLKLKKGDVRVSVHRLELQRIKFMVNSYLRIRLEKIQNNIFYYSSHTPDNPPRLTIQEAEFARDFRQNLLEHFDKMALRHLPGEWDTEKATSRPNLSAAVFVSVKDDVGEVECEGESVQLERDSQHMLQYTSISHLLDEERVQLI